MSTAAQRVHVVPFTDEHLDGAGELLAARWREDRQSEPRLRVSLEEPLAARDVVRAALDEQHAAGVAALRNGRMVGYLLGERVLPEPTSALMSFYQPRSALVGTFAHAAVAEGRADLYRVLYTALAEQCVATGYFAHYIRVSPWDHATLETFSWLGFGLDSVHSVRDVRTPVETRGGARIRRAGPDDADDVIRLTLANFQHHTRSPLFMPDLPECWPGIAVHQRNLLANPANAAFLAYQNGTAVGLQTLLPSEIAIDPERSIYLDHGYTLPEARGGGVARSLLAHALAWAGEAGHEHCTVTFMTANLLAARFWPSVGFAPLYYRLYRQVDERIAWAG